MTMPSALEISRRAILKPGFACPIRGDMRTMPGLTAHPDAEHTDIDADGRVVGLA